MACTPDCKTRDYVHEFADNRTFGTSSGRLKNDFSDHNNSNLDVTDVSDVSPNSNSDFLSAVPCFPLEVFPESLQICVDEHASAFSVPYDVPAVAILSTAGACIGRTRGLTIKTGWSEHANTYAVLVGRSGVGKSPAVKAIQAPVFELEAKWYRKYQQELKTYQEVLEFHKGRKKKDAAPDPLPDPPIYKQLIIDDSTTEALTTALTQNPRGILWNRDELSGLILDLDKYTGKDGGTKARLLSAYDAGPWKVNRNSGNKYIAHACLSIFGTIQDKALPEIFSSMDAATGFLPRFNFIRIEQDAPPLWSDSIVSERSKNIISDLFNGLMRYNFNNGEPLFIGVKKEAKALYIEWFNSQALEPWSDCESSAYEAVLAKLRGQCLRYCLILHCIESAIHGTSETEPVNADTMSKAIIFANYLKAHQKSVWKLCFSAAGVKSLKPFERRISESIIALESNITGGMLPTQAIVDHLNSGGDQRFATNSRSVGKALKGMGLETGHLPDKSGRGPKINPEFIEKLKNALGKRPKRPKRPTCQNNTEKESISNVRQTSQTSANQTQEDPAWVF